MSDDLPDQGDPATKKTEGMKLLGVRYSLVDMIEEVAYEREQSVMGRELVDAVEISKMFAKRKRKIRKS